MLATLGRAGSFDIAIIREMYRTGEVTIAGVDPRLNVSRIAARLKCSRAKVAARLEEWRRVGFITRYDVWPNPALFDLKGTTADLRIADPHRKAEVLEHLALLDGAVGAIEFQGPWLTYQFLYPDEATRTRRLRLLRHVTGVSEVVEADPWITIPPRRRPSALDLRILRALRGAPTASLQEIARAVGVSTRTVTSRYGALVADWSVWFLPVYDFTKLPGLVTGLLLSLDTPARREEVRRRLRRAYPEFLEFGWGGFGPVEGDGTAVFFVYLPSAAGLDDLERTAAEWEGVTAVESHGLVRLHTFGETLDGLLRTAVPAGTPSPRAQPARG